jgi:pre-rRNA-processing protein TSR1
MAGAKSQKNKVHKTKFASKSSRNAHKLAGGTSSTNGSQRAAAKSAPNGQRARDLRLQRNKNIRDHKRATVLAEKRAGKGISCAPRILAVVALSSSVNVEELKRLLVSAASSDEVAGISAQAADDAMETEGPATAKDMSGLTTIAISRFKLRLSVMEAPGDDLQACLEVAKVADIVAFAVSVSDDGEYVNKEGKVILSMLRGAGLPTTIGFVVGEGAVPQKRRAESKKAAVVALQTELPENSKCFSADSVDDFHQITRHLSEQRISAPQWRSERPYVVAQELKVVASNEDMGTLMLSGYVRGRGISVNQLVHLAGVGDFQFSQIEVLEDPNPISRYRKVAGNGQVDLMAVEEEGVDRKMVTPDPSLLEAVIVENTPDSLAGEQTWPTEEELSRAGQERRKRMKKRQLPKGTSDYQASWIVDDSDKENEDDDDDNSDEGSMRPESMTEDGDEEGSVLSEDDEMNDQIYVSGSKSESVWGEDEDDEEDGRSEMGDGEELTSEQRAQEIERLRAAHRSNEEFPDEMEAPTDRPARERFAKYRGLKSFRTSSWDPKESLPSEYSRIFAFDNFVRTQKHVLSKAKEIDMQVAAGSISINTFVRLHIKDVPLTAASALMAKFGRVPVIACGLLQHESKMSVSHFRVRKYEGYSEPIRSKEALIFHTGFRQYSTRPIFSSDDLNMDKHKFERFLPPGQFAIASVFAPVAFPPLPLIVFKETADGLQLVASGSLRSIDPDQVILKRIVLTGFPNKVSKRKAVVKFLFHNAQDVRWFRPLELWTKYGRRGRIKEPVGLHGSMKCVFDGVVQQRDAVCVSLYKRVYPKWPSQ